MKNKLMNSTIGSTLIYAIMVCTIILTMGLATAQIIFSEQKTTSDVANSTAAYAAAQSGIEYALKKQSCTYKDDVVWLDGSKRKIGFVLNVRNGMIVSTGIANNVRREFSTGISTPGSIDLVIDNGGSGGIVDISRADQFGCHYAGYTTLTKDTAIADQTIEVADVAGFWPGDYALLVQMKNAAGGYSGINNSRVELKIKSVDAGAKKITLEPGSPVGAIFPNGYTQVISVKNFKSIKITSNTTLKAPYYNGSTGGILALRSQGALTIDSGSKIDMTRQGYQGGAGGRLGQGPGAGGWTGSGNGGLGGNANSTSGQKCGTETNVCLGSGAGGRGGAESCGGCTGGSGGGLVILKSTTLNIYGEIEADGGGSSVSNYYGVAYGASGGGITIEANSIVFSGILSAAGGGGAGQEYGGWSGNVGNGGNGGGADGMESVDGGAGGGPGGPPGDGGSAGGGNGGNSAGGGGATGEMNPGSSGGGAGRILIRYSNFNGLTSLSGYKGAAASGATASAIIGPWAYFVKI